MSKAKLKLILFLIGMVLMTAYNATAQSAGLQTVVEKVVVEKIQEVEKVVTATPEPEAVTAVEQTLVLASGRAIGPINPHDYSSSMAVLDLVYEPLVRYGPDGSIQAALAESWEISADGLTWTFHLRPDVTFHDGTPFDAAAVKWNLERWVGSEDHNWLPTTSRIVGVEVVDPATIVLTLNESYYPAMQDLTLIRPVRFLSPKGVDANGELAQPIGTGPWQVESSSEEQTVLTPYPDYWGQKPALEKVIVEVILDPQTRIAALLSGEVDVIGGEYLGGISVESLPVLERNPTVKVLAETGGTTFYIATQYKKSPFDDLKVRQALNHAIDRQGISDTIFRGQAAPAEGLFPATIPYVTRTGTDLYSYNPAQAKSLLAEAGWTLNAEGILEKAGQPLKIDLVVDQSRLPQTATVAQALQAQLKEVGIELELRLMDYSGWLDAYYAGDYDLLMRFTWGPPYDPHTLLSGEFYEETEDAASAYTDPELTSLIEKVLASTDEQERQELYTQIWQLLDDNAAVVPLVYPQRVYAYRSEVQGFRLGGTEYDLAYAIQEVKITQ